MDNIPVKFGTDGWRAIIAEDFTFENVRICAQAVADYMKQSAIAGRGLVIGYDTRFASEDFAAAAAEVIAGNGIKVYLSPGFTPTPVVSYGVLAKKAGGAIVITASHNPHAWNGFKFKTADGAGAPGEVTAAIEKNIPSAVSEVALSRISLDEALGKGLVKYIDLFPFYYEHVEKLVDLSELRRSKLKVVIDPMYGTASGYLRKFLNGGSIAVTEIHGERNPLFPAGQPEPIPPNTSGLSAAVRELGADVGVATDGDADRMGIVDENGRFMTTLQVYALLCLYLLEIRGERGLLVRTVNSTTMINRLGELYGVPVKETPVGFKHIAQLMLDKEANVLAGGEESGGYGFRGHMPERDGMFSILNFLDLMVKTGKTPSQLLDYLFEKVGTHHYNRVDIHFPAPERQAIIDRVSQNPPEELEGIKVVKFDTFDGYRFTLSDGSWLLIRFSGTEPLLRIYAESSTTEKVEKLLDRGREIAGV